MWSVILATALLTATSGGETVLRGFGPGPCRLQIDAGAHCMQRNPRRDNLPGDDQMSGSGHDRDGVVPLRWRLLLVLFGGVIAGIVLSSTAGWRYGVLGGWIVGSGAFLLWMWTTIWPMDRRRTAAHARTEDPGRAAIDLIVLTAAVASLLAIGLVLASSNNKILHALLGVVSVALAWGNVHTVFTTRYARLYFAEPVGGIDFNEDDPPKYSDFAYFAFTVGMTFQVSDTDIKSKTIRALTLRHALLSYLFGAVILAFTINLVAGLGN